MNMCDHIRAMRALVGRFSSSKAIVSYRKCIVAAILSFTVLY